jgi:two-component system, cell cycle sensor histidine kinase and response regulator CckA
MRVSPRLPSAVQQIDSSLKRLPDWLQPYVIVLTALAGSAVITDLLIHAVGTQAYIVYSLLAVILLLGSAWLGYGPGVLMCVLVIVVVPHMLVPQRPMRFRPVSFGAVILISLLISRLGSGKRKTELSLRKSAADLEARVQERTLALQHLEEHRAWLAAIVESSDDAIIGKSLDGIITSWNQGAASLYGYTAEDAIGQPVAMLIPPDSDELDDILSRIRNGETVHRRETTRLHKDGRVLVVSLTVSPIRDSAGTIQGASTIARDMTSQRAAQLALEDSEHRYRLLFENNPQPMWVYDLESLAFLTVNNTAINSYGYTREEFLGMTLKDIRPPEDVARLLQTTADPVTQLNREGPWRHRKKDGKIIRVEITEHPILYGDRMASLVMATDITERLLMEEHFRQSQRLESVGRLAGGVAHDFNNLLTVINGYTEMLLTGPEVDAYTTEALGEIRKAGTRAAELTQQLLAFSRRQVIQPSVININTVVKDTERMLRRLIGEDVELITRLSPDLGQIQADAGQIQQIIVNLAINSRDAMPLGGSILIETSNVTLDESYRAEHGDVQIGPYIMLALTDTGVGMSAETRARVFEPFFTTKELGKGTGLGLATVYGMVKQGGGWIWVYSEVGLGTTFKVYLPRTDKPVSQTKPGTKTALRGTETILVVEDEDEVRKLTLTGLAGFGYTVHGASTGKEALAFCRDFPGTIHLILTDVVMTDMNGREVAKQVALVRPDARILFMSGYTANVIAHQGVLDPDVHYLQKPFTPDSLARKVREVLELRRDAQAGG